MEVEVFKTDVTNPDQANWLVDQLQQNFVDCKINFDLDDCDNILRIEHGGFMHPEQIINFLKTTGFNAEILPDTIQSMSFTEFVK